MSYFELFPQGSFASNKVWHPTLQVRGEEASVKIELPPEYFKRNITHISLTEIPPPLPCEVEPVYQLGTFYVLKISSKSFFRNQVALHQSPALFALLLNYSPFV